MDCVPLKNRTPVIAPWVGEAFFPISLAVFYIYVRHARRSAAPVLDLSLLKIKTFRIGTVTGGICRMGLDATSLFPGQLNS